MFGSLRWIWLVYAGLVLGFSLAQVHYFHSRPVARWGDTLIYEQIAEAPLTSLGFWAGRYAFTPPLLYKACGLDSECVTQGQFGLYLTSWLCLSAALMCLIRPPLLKLASVGVIFGLAFSADLVVWQRVLMSESLSNSLAVWSIALSFWAGMWLFQKERSPHQQFGVALALVLVYLLAAFARDPNGFYWLGLALLLALIWVFQRQALRPWRVFILTVILGSAAIFILQNRTASYANRSINTYPQNIFIRILPDPTERAFFAERGMPISEDLLSRAGQRINYADWSDELFQWLFHHGESTYINYLLARPRLLWLEPLNHTDDLLSGSVVDYGKTFSLPPRPLALANQWFYALSGFWLVGLLLTQSLIGLYLIRLRRWGWAWFIPLTLLLSLYPMMILVWHFGELELPRQMITANLRARLGIWLGLLLVLDEFWVSYRIPQPSPVKWLTPQRMGIALIVILCPLLLLEGVIRLNRPRQALVLPVVSQFWQTNPLEPWGVTDLEFQTYQDDLGQWSETLILSTQGTEPNTVTLIDLSAWTFTPQRALTNAAQVLALQQWQETAQTRYLHDLGIQLIYVDAVWLRQADPIKLANLEATYELLHTWESDGDAERRLYQVVGGEFAQIESPTLGLSPEYYAEYQTFLSTQPLVPAEATIFNPATRLDWFGTATEIGQYVTALDLSAAERQELYALMSVWDRIQYEADLALTPDQQAALTQWRSTKHPADLHAAGIEYLFYSNLWESYTTPEEYAQFRYSDQYQLVQEWKQNIPGGYVLLVAQGGN